MAQKARGAGARQGTCLFGGESGSLWIPMACAPVWGSGEAETLIDPPNPPVSQKGKGSCCLL